MTLSFRDKCILLFLAFTVCVYGGYKMVWLPTSEKVAELEQKKITVEGLAGDISPLLEQSEKLKKEEKDLKASVENVKNFSGGLTTTNEEFLVFLGSSSEKNNVAVTGFNDLGTTSDNGIYRTVFDFELKGSSVDINKVLEDINNIGIKCSFGSVSYRQNENFDYLKRFFDDLSELPWYQEPKEEEQPKDNVEIPPDEPKADVPPPEIMHPIPENPTPVIPNPTPVPTPEDKEPKTLEERLEDLLEQTAYPSNKPYKVMFLTNTEQNGNLEYKRGQDMRLAVTVCFVMYNEPSLENSFLLKTEREENAVL